jgi:hypothetical protein
MGLISNPSRLIKALSHDFRFVHDYLTNSNLMAEARVGAERMRPYMENYGFTFEFLGMACKVPVDPVEKQVKKFWKEQDQREKQERKEQERRAKKEREEQENAWKYDLTVQPEGQGWFWVKSHKRISCRGKEYTVRGHWRHRKPKQTDVQNAV